MHYSVIGHDGTMTAGSHNHPELRALDVCVARDRGVRVPGPCLR